MYTDPKGWKRVRRQVLQEQRSIKQVVRESGLSRNTVRRMVRSSEPRAYKRCETKCPRLGPHHATIQTLLADDALLPRREQQSILAIFQHLTTANGYEGSYSAVRRYVQKLRADDVQIELKVRSLKSEAGLAPPIVSTYSQIREYRLLSPGDGVDVTAAGKLKVTLRADRREQLRRSDREWMQRAAQGSRDAAFLIKEVGHLGELSILIHLLDQGSAKDRAKAMAVIARSRGISNRAISRFLGIRPKTSRRYRSLYDAGGVEALFSSRSASNRKSDDEELKGAVFALLHEPPTQYGINRTFWTMPELSRVLGEKGHPACLHVIRQITKAAGYRWRKARIVLTSKDPDYSAKLQAVQNILSRLADDEAFFSIDEFGPFSIKMKQGRMLDPPGPHRVVQQWQKSKGCLIMTAALELSGNQVTHFYSTKKNTEEMLRMMDVLLNRYRDRRKLYLSWDAASWHVSKKLKQRIEQHNSTAANDGFPLVETAPLPAGAQFLNVIESVFSGMARAIIHNSDYASTGEAKAAIDRYFEERNGVFQRNPKRAGKKIWGKELTPASFSEANNCKDPRYR